MVKTPFKMRSGNSTPFKKMGSSPAKLSFGDVMGSIDKGLRTNIDGSTSEGSLFGKNAHDAAPEANATETPKTDESTDKKKKGGGGSLNVDMSDKRSTESKDYQAGLKNTKLGVTNQ